MVKACYQTGQWGRCMPEGVTLTGIAWDHRRCWGPLDASVGPYTASRPNLTIDWHRRSLHEFGEGRLEDVVRAYDLIVFDHPFVGEVERTGLLIPLDPYLTDRDRAMFAAESVGRSWESYEAGGRQWALPIDAAAQVAAYRPDILARYGAPPRTHAEVLDLGRRLRADGLWLGLPLIPTDAMCLILTFAAMAGHRLSPSPDLFLPDDAVAEIVAQVRELAALSHPKSWDWNPIACYDYMVAHDDVAYVPFAFGYVNYASQAAEPRLLFADIPATPPNGSLLGGAGIGISAFCANPREAFDYAMHLCQPEFQRTTYVTAGGQPGMLSAWRDAACNRLTNGFFADTLATLEGAYLRSRTPGFVAFFRAGAPEAARAFKGEISPAELAARLNRQQAETMGLVLTGGRS